MELTAKVWRYYTALDADLRQRLKELASEQRRCGYRRLHIPLKREGIEVNWKKVYRIYREERLTVRKRVGRKRALGTRAPMAVPQAAGQSWSLDFVSDALIDGCRFLILCVIVDFSRECLATVVDNSISGTRVARALDGMAEQRGGYPLMVVSDNCAELTSNAMLIWQQDRGVEWHYIAPGKPMQNGFVESFMYRRPRGRKCFERDLHRRVRSCIRPVRAADTWLLALMVSADRGLINGTRFGALKALRAFSILSSADFPSRCHRTCAISSGFC